MNHAYEELKPYLERVLAFQTAKILFEWDNETLAPRQAGACTARVQGALAAASGAVENFDAEDLRDEEAFRQFITAVHDTDFEKDEPWYRWSYHVEELDEKGLFARLKERYASAPAFVLTKAEGDYYVSEPIGKPGKIRRIEIAKRGAGGIAQELNIETEKATYKVLSEYNIRYVLCDANSTVRKQDGSETVPKTLLPSGFLCWIPSAGLEKTGKMW